MKRIPHLWAASFNWFDLTKGKGASDPSHSLSSGQRGKKKTKKCLQDSLAPSNSTSPTDAASLSFLAVLTSLFLSAAQRWGFEARCPEGASLRTAKGPMGSEAPGPFRLLAQGSAPLVWAVCWAACSAHLTMLQSEGYGGGGVQWDVEGMERGGGSACVGLRPFMSPVMAMWVPIMGTAGEKEEHIVTQACLDLSFAPSTAPKDSTHSRSSLKCPVKPCKGQAHGKFQKGARTR